MSGSIETELNYNNEDFKALLSNILDIIGAVDQKGHIKYINAACLSVLGYESHEMIGKQFKDFVSPEDNILAEQNFKEIQEQKKKIHSVTRYLHKNGYPVHIQWASMWSAADNTLYFVGRDITELIRAETRLMESEQMYRALFDAIPDFLFVEDRNGVIININQSIKMALGDKAKQLIGLPASTILPAPQAALNSSYFQQALLGNTMQFDMELTVHGEKRIFDITKRPIIINQEIVGVQTIAKDITHIVRSYQTVQQQAKKLSNIFESITDAFFMLDTKWNFTYINSEAEQLLSLDKTLYLGKNMWLEFPSKINGTFYKEFHHAIETGSAVHFEAYYSKTNKWLNVKAYPSEEGISVYAHDVTEQVREKQELEMLSLVASNTTHGIIFTDKDRRIEWVNESFTKLTGYSLQEAKGAVPAELLHNEQVKADAYEAVKDKLMNGESVRFETENIKKSGEKMWNLVQINPTIGKSGAIERYVTIHTDITEMVLARQELEKLSLVASKTTNGVIITDKEDRIEWVNEGFSNLLGYSLQEIVGQKPSDVLRSPRTDASAYEKAHGRLMNGKRASFEILNVKKNGAEVWLSVQASPILKSNGEISRYIGVCTDITAIKNSEQELAKSAQILYGQNKDLQQFTYMVSHNLRAPVANIIGLANILRIADKDSELYNKTITNLNKSISNLDIVLRDMNAILSVRDSKGNLETEQVDFKLILEQAQASLQKQFYECNGSFTYEVEEKLSIWANKAYLHSIFYNLLSNAIKYRADERPLEVQVKAFTCSERGVVITFSDNGSGIEMSSAKDNIFKLYKRFHLDKKGRGIGLYLVKSHIEAMEGTIEITSSIGIGTTFTICFPNPTQKV